MSRIGTTSDGKPMFDAKDVKKWEDYLQDVCETGPRWREYVDKIRKKYPNNLFNVYNETVSAVTIERQRRAAAKDTKQQRKIEEEKHPEYLEEETAGPSRNKRKKQDDNGDNGDDDSSETSASASSTSKSKSTSASQESLKQTSLPSYLPSVKRHRTVTSMSIPNTVALEKPIRIVRADGICIPGILKRASPTLEKDNMQRQPSTLARPSAVIDISDDDSDEAEAAIPKPNPYVVPKPGLVRHNQTFFVPDTNSVNPNLFNKAPEASKLKRSGGTPELDEVPILKVGSLNRQGKVASGEVGNQVINAGPEKQLSAKANIGRTTGIAEAIGNYRWQDIDRHSTSETHPAKHLIGSGHVLQETKENKNLIATELKPYKELAFAIDYLCNGGRRTDLRSVISGQFFPPLPLDEDGFVEKACFDETLTDLRSDSPMPTEIIRLIYEQIFGTPSRLATIEATLAPASEFHKSDSTVSESMPTSEESKNQSADHMDIENPELCSAPQTIAPSLIFSTQQNSHVQVIPSIEASDAAAGIESDNSMASDYNMQEDDEDNSSQTHSKQSQSTKEGSPRSASETVASSVFEPFVEIQEEAKPTTQAPEVYLANLPIHASIIVELAKDGYYKVSDLVEKGISKEDIPMIIEDLAAKVQIGVVDKSLAKGRLMKAFDIASTASSES